MQQNTDRKKPFEGAKTALFTFAAGTRVNTNIGCKRVPNNLAHSSRNIQMSAQLLERPRTGTGSFKLRESESRLTTGKVQIEYDLAVDSQRK